MKKLLIIVLCLGFCAIAHADSKFVYYQNTMTGTLAAGATEIIGKTNLDNAQIDGFFALEVVATGDGTLKIEYVISFYDTAGTGAPADSYFIRPSSASDVVTAHTKTSGSASDGKDIYGFGPVLAGWIGYRLTETGTSDTITYTINDRIR